MSNPSAWNPAAVAVPTPTSLAYALTLLVDRHGGECENSTGSIGDCFASGRTADAVYGCDLACAACIAHAALAGQHIPRGPGAEAMREQARKNEPSTR